jgi:WD40 repeat protein
MRKFKRPSKQEAEASDQQTPPITPLPVLILTSHTEDVYYPGTVWSTQFSSDGTAVVTAIGDERADEDAIYVWDASSGERLAHVSDFNGSVYSAAFSPHGTQLVCSSNNTISVWETNLHQARDDSTATLWRTTSTPRCRLKIVVERVQRAGIPRILDTHKIGPPDRSGNPNPTVLTTTFSPDGTTILAASSDGIARLWNTQQGHLLGIFESHTASVRSAAFSPDGRYIVTASMDHTARIWDVGSGRSLSILTGHTKGLNSAAWSPDGSRIVTAANDETARVWDVESGQCLYRLKAHRSWVIGASFSLDGTRIVTGTDDALRVWDAQNGYQLRILKPDSATFNTLAKVMISTWHIKCAAWSPDSARIIVGGDNGLAWLWDVN